MAKVYIGNAIKRKMYLGNTKIKKGFLDSELVFSAETNYVTDGVIDESVCNAASLSMLAYTEFNHGKAENMSITLNLTDVDTLYVHYTSTKSGGSCTCSHWFDHQTIAYQWDAFPGVNYDNNAVSGVWWYATDKSDVLTLDVSNMTGWHTLYFTCRVSYNFGSVGFTVTNIKGE